MNVTQFCQIIKKIASLGRQFQAIYSIVLHVLADEVFKFSALGYIKVPDVSLDSGRWTHEVLENACELVTIYDWFCHWIYQKA